MEIRKAADVVASGTPNESQLNKINTFARAPLTADEVYVFSVRLCDTLPDIDGEAFAPEAIYALAPMFVGKTGILNHQWSADNQLGRIFDTAVVEEGGVCWLKAWVYMLRTEKTASFIREIEGGIKKEVSVGCAMGKTICSICGAEYGICDHEKGQRYGANICTAILTDPVDAYEFSFVAVPAQREAGVVKTAGKDAQKQAQLEKEASYGRMYRKALLRDVTKLYLLLDMGADENLIRKMAESLSVEELVSLSEGLQKKAQKALLPVTQLGGNKTAQGKPDSAFLI